MKSRRVRRLMIGLMLAGCASIGLSSRCVADLPRPPLQPRPEPKPAPRPDPKGESLATAVAGVALGGPAVGAMLLLVQQLFKKPLNEVSELSYHLGGTWENPDIQKGDSVKPAKHVP